MVVPSNVYLARAAAASLDFSVNNTEIIRILIKIIEIHEKVMKSTERVMKKTEKYVIF